MSRVNLMTGFLIGLVTVVVTNLINWFYYRAKNQTYIKDANRLKKRLSKVLDDKSHLDWMVGQAKSKGYLGGGQVVDDCWPALQSVEDQLLGMRPKSATLERSLADIILDQQPLEMISIEIEALAEQVSLIAEELLPVTSKLDEILSEHLVNNR